MMLSLGVGAMPARSVLLSAIGVALGLYASVVRAELELPTTDELAQAMAAHCGLKATKETAGLWLMTRSTKDRELFKRLQFDPAWKAAEIERMVAEGMRFLAEAKDPGRPYSETKALSSWSIEDYVPDRGGIVVGTGRVYRVNCDAAADRLASMGIYLGCDFAPERADGTSRTDDPVLKAVISARYPGELGVRGLVLPLTAEEAMTRFATPARTSDPIRYRTGADYVYRIDGCVTERNRYRPKSRLTATIVQAAHYDVRVGAFGIKRLDTLVEVK